MRTRSKRTENDPRETFWQFIERMAARKSVIGCRVTADNYHRFGKSLKQYAGDKNPALYLEDITEEFVKGYETWLKRRGLNLSTVSYYNRLFRSLYNQAARDGLIRNAHPFDGAYTKVIPPKKPIVVDIDGMKRELKSLSKVEILRQYGKLADRYASLVKSIREMV